MQIRTTRIITDAVVLIRIVDPQNFVHPRQHKPESPIFGYEKKYAACSAGNILFCFRRTEK